MFLFLKSNNKLTIPNCYKENNVLLYRFNRKIFNYRHSNIPLIKEYIKNILSFHNFEALKDLFQVFKEDRLIIHELLNACFKFHFPQDTSIYGKNILILSETIKTLRDAGVFQSSTFYDYNFAVLDIIEPQEVFDKDIIEDIDDELFLHYILTKISESVFLKFFFVFYRNTDYSVNQKRYMELVNDGYELKHEFNAFIDENKDKVDYFLNKIKNQEIFNIYQSKVKKSILNLIKSEENKPEYKQTKKEFYLFLDKFFDLLNNYFSKRIPT